MFTPARAFQRVCGVACAVQLIERKRAEAAKRQTRERLAELEPLRKVIARAQRAFNAYVRERDAKLPCISCGRTPVGRHKWDAGHYRSTAAAPGLRFDESNVNRQCVECNRHKSGNLIAYRAGLVERVGLAEVLRLEGPTPPRKWDRDELRRIAKESAAKARQLRKGRSGND